MPTPLKVVKTNTLLFREGDPSECMYVVKTGKLSVYKQKGSSEIELAVIGPGQMIGEMAFFDQKPRSASVKALQDSEVIELPFKPLMAQYATFPEWLKSMVRTINDHLRESNKRIKNLEQGQASISYKDGGVKSKGTSFTPHQANKLCGIINLVAAKFGTVNESGGVELKPGDLRRYTIQVFQEPTAKMQTIMDVLSSLAILKQEDLGEGKVKLTLLQPKVLHEFVEWMTEYLYMDEDKRITVPETEMKNLKAVVHFAKKLTPDDKGNVKLNLTEIQNESMKELSYLVGTNDLNALSKLGLLGEKMQEKDQIMSSCNKAEVERIFPLWQIFYTLIKE